MSELRECPFCGGALRIAAKRWFRSHCPTCHMIGPMPDRPAVPTRESAIRASNTRHIQNTRPASRVEEAARLALDVLAEQSREFSHERRNEAMRTLRAALAQEGEEG